MKMSITAMALILVLVFSTVNATWALKMEIPDSDIRIDKVIGSSGTDGNASVTLCTELFKFNTPEPPYFYNHITMNVSMVGNTRKGIFYGCETQNYLFDWMSANWQLKTVLQEFENFGDDNGVWVDLPLNFFIKFYGGVYRNFFDDWMNGTSSKVWICTNGFIGFDVSNSTSPNPSAVPSSSAPNAIIAPLWTDLEIDSQSKIIVMCSQVIGLNYFVVIWENALHKASLQRLTFAVAIKLYTTWDWEQDPHSVGSPIYFAYQNVADINGQFAYGLEDHEGFKGEGELLNGNQLTGFNGKTKVFWQPYNQYVKNLTLKFEDENYQNAAYDIMNETIRGFNVRTKTYEQPTQDQNKVFLKTLIGTANYAVGFGGAAAQWLGLIAFSVTPFTLPVGFALVAWNIYDWYALNQYNNIDWADLADNLNTPGTLQYAFIKVPALTDVVQDASLDAGFSLELADGYSGYHNLTITAILEYATYETGGTYNVTTSVNIEVGPDDNNDFLSATQLDYGSYGAEPMLYLGEFIDINDYYFLWLQQSSKVVIELLPPAHLLNPDMYLYRANDLNDPVARSENPGHLEETIGFIANCSGVYFIKVNCSLGVGFYNITISQGAALSASVCYYPAGAGTINLTGTHVYKLGEQVNVRATANPGFVFSHWRLDSTNYYANPITVTMNQDHNLTAYFATSGGGGDGCPSLLVWNGDTYLNHGVINIHNSSGADVTREISLAKEHVSVADHKVKATLLEGWPDLNFSESVIDQVKLYAIDAYGHRLLCPLINATHSTQGSVLLPLLFSDNWKTQILLLETIDTTFLMPYPQSWIQNYTFVIEGCNKFKL